MKKLRLSIISALLLAGCAANQTGTAGSDLGTPRQYQGPPPSEQIKLSLDVPAGWTRLQKGEFAKVGEIDNLISNEGLKAGILAGIVPAGETTPAEGAAIFALKLVLAGTVVSKVTVSEDGSQASFTWTAAGEGLAGKVVIRVFPEKKQLLGLFLGQWAAVNDAQAAPVIDAVAASAKIVSGPFPKAPPAPAAPDANTDSRRQ